MPESRAVARQAPLHMGFSRPECWSGLPFPSTGDLPDPGIESGSPTSQADSSLPVPRGELSFTRNMRIMKEVLSKMQ